MVLKYGVNQMSEVTVLDIPLQNSLTPRVGTYSGEGRSDTTFEYDSESGEYSLVSDSITRGYYYYYPIQPVPAENIIIEFDIKINNSSYWLLLFNCGTESTTDNWWGYYGYSTGGMKLNLHGTVKDIYLNDLNQEWHHITVYVQKVESENKTYFCTKDNGVICDYSGMANFDCTIYNLALLGNDSDIWGAKANFKNIKVLGDISSFAHINLHLGNEVLRAYAMPPIPDKSTLAIISFKGIVDGDIVKTYNTDVQDPCDEYTIPDTIDNTKSSFFRFGITYYARYSDNPSNHYSFYYDSDFHDYIFEKTSFYDNSGHAVGCDLMPLNADYLGFANTQRKLAIEFKKAITNWKPGEYITPDYKFGIALIADIDPIINTSFTNNTICEVCCNNTGHFTCYAYNAYNNGTAISAQDDLAIELDAIHTYSVYIERNYPVKTLLIKCYIDGQLRHTETITNVGAHDCSFYLKDNYYALYKMGTIKVFNDEPGSSFKKLNVKRNNSLYYLLASNTGLYPSRLRTKIDGTTYSILTKHDLDT